MKGLQSPTIISSTRDSEQPDDSGALLQEIRALRSELRALGQNPSPAPLRLAESTRLPLKVSFDRVVGERKPFVLRCDGAFDFELKMSSMRAALLLSLLLDLYDRSAGGVAAPDTMTRMIAVYRALEGTEAADDQVVSLIRVGLYRLELSLHETPIFENSEVSLIFNAQLHRLDISPKAKIQKASELAISISSSDPKILATIDTFSSTSPLDRARQQKSMYISSSERGWDQLFLEFFNHKQQVRNTSLFYRPALPTYPDEILRCIEASPATFTRKKVMLEGYKSGRVIFHEILNRNTLWDMITKGADGSFKLYPAEVTPEMIAQHLRQLQFQLDQFPGYTLSLTDAVFPFIIGVVELGAPEKMDAFTMFYRQPPMHDTSDVTCFVLHDPFVAQSMVTRVISAVLEHPSTVSGRREVSAEIAHVLDYLQMQGPIVK
jgi:hypothetical protein